MCFPNQLDSVGEKNRQQQQQHPQTKTTKQLRYTISVLCKCSAKCNKNNNMNTTKYAGGMRQVIPKITNCNNNDNNNNNRNSCCNSNSKDNSSNTLTKISSLLTASLLPSLCYFCWNTRKHVILFLVLFSYILITKFCLIYQSLSGIWIFSMLVWLYDSVR